MNFSPIEGCLLQILIRTCVVTLIDKTSRYKFHKVLLFVFQIQSDLYFDEEKNIIVSNM